MSKKEVEITISLDNVDYDRLITEEDFINEANKHLPKLIDAIGTAVGEMLWDSLSKTAFRPKEGKVTFLRKHVASYSKQFTQADRRAQRARIIQQLKENKAEKDKVNPSADKQQDN